MRVTAFQSTRCPACGYDLGASASGACPECGHQFDAGSLDAREHAEVSLALGLIGYGLYQLYRAYQVDLDDQLDLSTLSSGARAWVVRAARGGAGGRSR